MITNKGLELTLDAALANMGDLTLKLFTNDLTISATSVVGDFTEATFVGYSAKTLTAASWGDAATTSGVATAAYATQTFTAGGSETIRGWWIQDASANLIAAKKNATSKSSGTGITVTPTYSLEQP
jgi:hypothetical protein